MPSIIVIANPLTGPVPNLYKTIPAIKVVIFASKITVKASENPRRTTSCAGVPVLLISRILSKIKIDASIAIPTVKTIPAMPGNVKAAPNFDKKNSIMIRLKTNAKKAKSPGNL